MRAVWIFSNLLLLSATMLAVPVWANANKHYPIDNPTLELQRIAFGSCAKERMDQPVWDMIARQRPDMFLFIGDNVYADQQMKDGEMISTPVTNPRRFQLAYSDLAEKAPFQRFRQQVPMLAVWDDHDYGMNDGGKEYPLKIQSQQAFLNFFNISEYDDLRHQHGIYHSRMFGPAGRRVQIIMLDTRFNRDPLVKKDNFARHSSGPYQPTTEHGAQLLGVRQWNWLKQQLKQPADVRIIASSIQVVAWEHGWETWGNFPHERQRLYDLISETGANGVFFVSGDRHLTEISRDTGELGNRVPYPMWDFTSSGLTDEWEKVREDNSFRVGQVYRQTNFGVIDINWAPKDAHTSIKFTAYDKFGHILLRQTVALDSLQIQR